MRLTHRARRFAAAPVAFVALSLTAALPAAADPLAAGTSAYAIVLLDGSVVPASTRPLIAMGKVSFLDGQNRACTLPVQRVDVEATRARVGPGAPRARTWTDRSIKTVRGRIQVVGESEPIEVAAAEVAPGSNAERADATQAERIRAEIDRLETQLRPLAPKDHQRTVLMLRQLELQEELSRILHPARTS